VAEQLVFDALPRDGGNRVRLVLSPPALQLRPLLGAQGKGLRILADAVPDLLDEAKALRDAEATVVAGGLGHGFIAGMNRGEFLKAIEAFQVSPFQDTPASLRAELEGIVPDCWRLD
jgi:hypothetical protein